ncbi:f-box domain-containing protein [Cyclospora cayetanensis]|uniref:F-box domain-containing protein n=1 Tax=Cyclospora cayetanensis TaxID=88456 RepID=A0A1D3D517_9EIME|nr:f-box domain-containing protein [Cyclospora cayetanensis]
MREGSSSIDLSCLREGCGFLPCRDVYDVLPRAFTQQTEAQGLRAGSCERSGGVVTPDSSSLLAKSWCPPLSCFTLRSRGDAWALLDWKTVAVDPDGSLHVLDFCDISTKTEHDMLYIHPETGESVLPRKKPQTQAPLCSP